MIYVRLKLYAAQETMNDIIDFLENLGIPKKDMDWTPDRSILKFRTNEEDDITAFESYIIHVLDAENSIVEWEFQDEEENVRYMAQYKSITNNIDKIYLIPFKENIEYMWG